MFLASAQSIIEGIIPSVPEFITAIISVTILLIVVTLLMYKPLKKSIQDRKDYIAANIENSEKRLDNANDMKSEAKQVLDSSRDQGKNIINTSVREANEKSNQILGEAKDRSHQIIDSARNQAKSEIKNTKSAIKGEAVDIAIALSEKLMNEKIDTVKDAELINEFINNLEDNVK